MFASDPADLFAQLYDSMPERCFAEHAEAEDWIFEDAVMDIASIVEGQTLDHGHISAELVERFLDLDEDPEADEDEARKRFAVMVGLDRAFLQVDLQSASSDTGGLTEMTVRLIEQGRLDSGAVPGMVLPRVAVPGQEHLIPPDLASAFLAVVRVPHTSPIPVEHTPMDDWPSRSVRTAGLRVAALPAFGPDDPFTVERVEERVPCYRLRLDDPDDLEAWVAQRLAALDGAEATIAVLPEMALTPGLRAAWQDVCASTPVPSGGMLELILVGTGPDVDGTRPHNRATVIRRRTGEIVLSQDKLHRFQLEDTMIDRWDLRSRLGDGPLEEWCRTGTCVEIREAPGMRLVVLVCEDLTELTTTGVVVQQWGVSVCLSPIFSAAIREHRWETTHAAFLHACAGVQTVVSNSLYLGDREPSRPEPVGTALGCHPVQLLASADVLDPQVVRFTELGTVPLV